MTDAITAPFCAYRGIKIEFVITFMIDAIAEPGRRISRLRLKAYLFPTHHLDPKKRSNLLHRIHLTRLKSFSQNPDYFPFLFLHFYALDTKPIYL